LEKEKNLQGRGRAASGGQHLKLLHTSKEGREAQSTGWPEISVELHAGNLSETDSQTKGKVIKNFMQRKDQKPGAKGLGKGGTRGASDQRSVSPITVYNRGKAWVLAAPIDGGASTL